MSELNPTTIISILAAVISSLGAVTPFIWSFSSWKTKTEHNLQNNHKRIENIEALNIGVELATIRTTLSYIQTSQEKIEALLKKQ